MKENPVKDKSYVFALEIVKVYKQLSETHKEYLLSKQLLRSGTSIGANVAEAVGSFSKKDFIYKMQIAYKESLETDYWINILHDSEMLSQDIFDDLRKKLDELLKLLSSILKTSKSRL